MSTLHSEILRNCRKKTLKNCVDDTVCVCVSACLWRSVPTGIRKTVIKNYFLASTKIRRSIFVYNVNVAVDAETQSHQYHRNFRRDTQTSVRHNDGNSGGGDGDVFDDDDGGNSITSNACNRAHEPRKTIYNKNVYIFCSHINRLRVEMCIHTVGT